MLKLDAVILGKFDELEQRAQQVSASQQVTDVAALVDSRKFQQWASGSMSLLQKVYGEKNPYYRSFHGIYSKIINLAYKESFDNCRGIMQSAREEYERGASCDLRLYLEHAVLKHLAASTEQMLKRGDKETACILAGVLLEQALQRLCSGHKISFGTPEQMNESLYRAGAYLVGTQQRVKDWCCMKDDFIRSYGDKYRPADVDDMLRGVTRFIEKELGGL